MLTGLNQQIVTAFESEGMTVTEIAEAFEVELLAIKATLFQFSPKFREDLKNADKSSDMDFKDNDLIEANQAMMRIARCAEAEDPNLSFRIYKYVRNDKKGRLDILSGIRNLNMNVAVFNERLIQAREAVQLSKNGNEQPPKQIEEQSKVQEAIEV